MIEVKSGEEGFEREHTRQREGHVKMYSEPGILAQAYNPSTWEAESGGS
jgi:hypothetical protein